MITNIINNFTFLIWVKLIVLLLLFIFNIHLYFLDSNNTPKTKNKVLESRLFSNKKFKQYFRYFTATYLLYITILSTNTDSDKNIHLNSNLELSENISTKNEKGVDTFYEGDDTQNSFMLSFFFDKFESLDTYSKLALSMLMFKSVLISALISLIFIAYGEYLITRFKLETRFPKLAIIINLRRKFTRYYLIWNCSIIAFVIFAEVFFYISILLR